MTCFVCCCSAVSRPADLRRVAGSDEAADHRPRRNRLYSRKPREGGLYRAARNPPDGVMRIARQRVPFERTRCGRHPWASVVCPSHRGCPIAGFAGEQAGAGHRAEGGQGVAHGGLARALEQSCCHSRRACIGPDTALLRHPGLAEDHAGDPMVAASGYAAQRDTRLSAVGPLGKRLGDLWPGPDRRRHGLCNGRRRVGVFPSAAKTQVLSPSIVERGAADVGVNIKVSNGGLKAVETLEFLCVHSIDFSPARPA